MFLIGYSLQCGVCLGLALAHFLGVDLESQSQ